MQDWLSGYANESDLRAIEDAVSKAEARTSGEIVPMIVRSSTLTGHVQPLLSLFWLVLLLVVTSYVAGARWVWDLPAVALSLVLGFLCSRVPFFQRSVTSRKDEALSVFHRAQLEFHETGIPHTEGRTGVLIFVSLSERRAVILGDRAISEKLNAETWIKIVDGLLAKMREGRAGEGFTGAIAAVGEILAREFPILPGDTNELPNALVVKD